MLQVRVNRKNAKTYTFDKVYGMYSNQADVFTTTVKPLVQEVMQGFNCTVFAYGQVGIPAEETSCRAAATATDRAC